VESWLTGCSSKAKPPGDEDRQYRVVDPQGTGNTVLSILKELAGYKMTAHRLKKLRQRLTDASIAGRR
jgi:hypothetical protein